MPPGPTAASNLSSTSPAPTSSSSVFARLTGRRHPGPPPPPLPSQQDQQQQQPIRPSTQPGSDVTRLNHFAADASLDDHDAAPPPPSFLSGHRHDELNRGKSRNGSHRRDSSLLSLTASVTDLGSTVRRSVSLRSHRTNPSSSSSFRGLRSTSSNNVVSPLGANTNTQNNTTISPVESPEKNGGSPRRDTTTSPSRPRGRPSLSVRTLTHKFKSTENLPKFSPIEPLDSAISSASPPSAYPPPPKSTFASMLIGTHPNVPAAVRAPSDRPGLPGGSVSYGGRESSSVDTGGGGASLHRTNTTTTTTGASVTTSGSSGNPNSLTVYQQIQETAAKRIATIDYLRRVHEGDIFYFSTLHYSPAALAAMPSLAAHKLGRRATAYWILGYSLPALLDLHAGTGALEILRALSALLAEFETYQTLAGYDASSGASLSRGRVAGMLKSGMGMSLGGVGRSGRGRRTSTATAGSGADSLAHIHDPPPPSSAIDVEQQASLLGIPRSAGGLSPSLGSGPPDPSSTTTSPAVSSPATDLAAALASMPSVSVPNQPVVPPNLDFTHLLTPALPFEPDFSTTLATLCDALADCYGRVVAEVVDRPEQAAAPGVAEAFAKVDKAVRKILVSQVVREFEEVSRAGVRGEVAGLGKVVLGGLM